ncbi:MAG: maltose alpha-D-glucosyltransferase [Prosthecobacter sp.]|jgi:maltose alpha-D-glucosyltransferase/alpha-amylase|uniref:maltose alpha-D-glucosyltransferase n=1 Tax=Prosthecobacter sp. TaxID=1965333 RepID=UPI0019FC60D1|nr:maltose alpha-D-glucosyltransferase [Prosthecobacter sp.]MBE2284601.1 maltose alpha-D-glucosyltransferase [Prosthecobacter sp.]
MNDPLWFKDAVIYQLHVRAYCDGDGDGIGDFPGLISKLDYLRQLGVTAIWLLPFYPSPLRDDGYDTADYMAVNPTYGTLADFQTLLDEAHRRDIRVITELVLNHTSDQHAWFQRARRAKPGSPERDFYVWSDTPDRYREARIIFKDFEQSNWAWDPVANAYYWHRFYSHQPDLNWENPEVEKAMFKTIDFWLGMGVDGLRLDAVPYLIERDGTNCENLPETHAILRRLRAHIDSKFPDRMLLAEANQWPEEAAAYFGKDGDECSMAFHFPVMPRLFMALQMEDRFPIIDILEQTPAIPANSQWAMFLRNHDELTLEMVTDEERDYMYRVYASDQRARINLGIRRRLAPLLRNSRRKIELLNVLLLSLTGTPIIYYGDEIGMGDNIYLGDRNGVRTPMQWSMDRNAGFSRASAQQLYFPVIIESEYHYEAVNVETQERNPSSLLWWTRRIVAMRQRFKAFGRGSMEFLPSDNPRVLAFVKEYENEKILVIANLSRFAQPLELDLSRWQGLRPVEVFSHNRFPVITAAPCFYTMGPHDYLWLTLEPEQEPLRIGTDFTPALVEGPPTWQKVLETLRSAQFVQHTLPECLRHCRWFGGKGHALRSVNLLDAIPLGMSAAGGDAGRLAFLEASYYEVAPETYLLPLQITESGQGSESVIARFSAENGEGMLFDALDDENLRSALFEMIVGEKRLRGKTGELAGFCGEALKAIAPEITHPVPSRALRAEQSNSAIIYDSRFFLKIYRRPEAGPNPDVELLRFLSERQKFENVPGYCGRIDFHAPGCEPRTLALLVANVSNEGDAWTYTLDSLGRFFERVLSQQIDSTAAGPERIDEIIGGVYPERARLLGERTAQMHLALAADHEDPRFAPEAFTGHYQRSLYQSMRAATRRMHQLLERRLPQLPETCLEETSALLGYEESILARLAHILDHKVVATRIRHHGDYHLGQVLNTGRDFNVIDFEGEPARPLSERCMKRSPLRDVAGMLRSFHYAAHTARSRLSAVRAEDVAHLETWAEIWVDQISRQFIDSYLRAAGTASFIPRDEGTLNMLLEVFMLEKAVYEVVYEINNRPDWLFIPIRGIRRILEGGVRA